MITIKATDTAPTPTWALLERELMATLEEGALLTAEKYSRSDGVSYFIHDVDDVYEARSMRGLLYAIGGGDRLLDLALKEWNGTTRFYDDAEQDETAATHPEYVAQLHNEYYNLGQAFEWFHQGEGNHSFYELGLADPDNTENRDRAIRFAAMFIGEDPEAPNYDPEHRVIRSPFPSSVGPLFNAGAGWGHGSAVDFVKMLLAPVYGAGGRADRASLYPVVRDLEPDWFERPGRSKEIVKIFNEVILNGDVPTNLTATGLVTNAYLYTGDEKYKTWVLDYTEAWLERMKANDGVMPDNVGPTGKIGENRQGQWWGGLYGWQSRWAGDIMFGGLTVAAECAVLLSGDVSYLEILRSQLELLLNRSKTREDGQLLLPGRYGPEGWDDYKPRRILEFAHLYHASMSPEDYALITHLRDGERERDWNHVDSESDRRNQNSEFARFQYYDGKNPEWPEKILRAEMAYARNQIETIQADQRDVDTIISENKWPPNPVVSKGLTQITMGTPQIVYNGGLLRGLLRYFDPDRRRPGLPDQVAALVDNIDAEGVGVHLVNLHPSAPRNVIVQSGAFGEHAFETVGYTRNGMYLTVAVSTNRFLVNLPPESCIHLDMKLRRHVNTPGYAAPDYEEANS